MHEAPTPATAVSQQGKENLEYIDLLRGLAILGVLLVHSTQKGMVVSGLDKLPLHTELLLLAGRHGVALFFVVSAYTLMRSMHSRIDVEHMPMRKYFLRRFFRIAPAYYVVLLIVFFAYGKGFPGYVDPAHVKLTWPDLSAHLLFVNGFFPYYTNDFLAVEWSVSTEFLFYLMLPFIFLGYRKAGKKFHSMWKIAGLYLASIAFLWGMFFKGEYLQHLIGQYPPEIFHSWAYFFILTHLHEFIIGVGVWVLLQIAGRGAATSTDGLKLIVTLAVGTALAYVEYYWRDSVYVAIFASVLWGLLSAELIYLLDALRPPAMRGLTFLGKVSFSLYLVHFPIFASLSHSHKFWKITKLPEIDFLIYETVVLGLSLLLATLLFYGVERPGMRLGKHVVGRLPARKLFDNI